MTGAAVGLALGGLFGLMAFMSHVDSKGQTRDFGLATDTGCVQGSYRYDPIDVDQYTNILLGNTCSNPPVPAGLQSFPRPGQVFVSPALADLRATDAAIATRFPRIDGIIRPSGLTGSNELRSIIGVEPAPPGKLPLGTTAFDQFGTDADYLGNYLRFGPAALRVIGLFFTLLPAGSVIGACTKLNARTRQRQFGLLSVIGADPTAIRRAMVYEAVVTVTVGSAVGALLSRLILPQLTPTFAAWKAFPGDLRPGWLSLAIVVVLAAALSAAAAWRSGRSLARSATPGTEHRQRATGLRWTILTVGVLAAAAAGWWHDDSAWPLIVGGRVATFVGLILVAAPVCVALGRRLSRSTDPVRALVGARLEHPSGSLTRALAALVAGLFLLSAGATTISSAQEDPAALQQGYAADGYSVLEARRPAVATQQTLASYDVLAGTNTSTDPDIAGSLRGSCRTVSQTLGANLECRSQSYFLLGYPEQTVPTTVNATPLLVANQRAATLAGFVVTITDRAVIDPADDDIFVPLPSSRADHLYDQLVGADATTNVRIAGAATVSGASELNGILDVFRWGSAFAVAVFLLAVLVSLVALLFDRQAGNNYLQILGLSRRRTSVAALTEVTAAAAATLGIALFGSWLWALSFRDRTPVDLATVVTPFIVAFAVLAASASLLVWFTFRTSAVGVVPDRDGVSGLYDVH